MQFDNSLDLKHAVAKADIRHHLTMIHAERNNGGEGGLLYATDGVMIVFVPVTMDESDTSGPVRVDAFESARTHAKNNKQVLAEMKLTDKSLNVPGNGVSFDRQLPEGQGDLFQGWKKFHDYKLKPKKTARLSLNADLLLKLVKAVGGNGIVTISFNINEVGDAEPTPAIVECVGAPEGSKAVLHTCRL